MAKKLAGAAASTAAWVTSVGNEHGQILVSVLTAAEGEGLQKMANGLVKRYHDAHEASPTVLYVDRDCCSTSDRCAANRLFSGWPDLQVRLDIWHFMRRFVSAVNTETHQLFPTFMRKLSACIFVWDASDLEQLKTAKRNELDAQHVNLQDDQAVMLHITRRELERHCRRTTRGVDVTTRLIQELIDALDSPAGCDTLGI